MGMFKSEYAFLFKLYYYIILTFPAERMLILLQALLPKTVSISFSYDLEISIGTKAKMLPATPPPCTLTAPLVPNILLLNIIASVIGCNSVL